MDVKSTLAAQSYAATRPATAPEPKAGSGAGEVFSKTVEDFAARLRKWGPIAKRRQDREQVPGYDGRDHPGGAARGGWR